MSTPDLTAETTVDDSYSVPVPAEIRDCIDVEPGDEFRWTLAADGTLRVEVVRQRYGTFEDLEPIDVGGPTDAVEETEVAAYEGEKTHDALPDDDN